MPAKRCIETKNMCLLFVDYCIEKAKAVRIPMERKIFGYIESKSSKNTQNREKPEVVI